MNLKELYKKHENYQPIDDDDRVFDMANLSERSTGINTTVFISTKVERHVPRIKVRQDGKEFSVSIEDEPKVLVGDPSIVKPKVLKQVIEWVKLNKEGLLYYWNHPDEDYFELHKVIKSFKKV